jgi:hypothetical protein
MYNTLSIKDAYLFIFVSLAYYWLTTRIYATTTYPACGPLVRNLTYFYVLPPHTLPRVSCKIFDEPIIG